MSDAARCTDGLFELRPTTGTIALLGGYSPTSGQYHFPRLAHVPVLPARTTSSRSTCSARRHALGVDGGHRARRPATTATVPFGFGVVELAASGCA